MKRGLVTGLGISLLGAVLPGCAADGSTADDGEPCLPGDIDCFVDPGGGKSDGWDQVNSPERAARQLNYRLAELPARGTLTTPTWKDAYPDAVGRAEAAWADTYWPSIEGSHNHRWQGPAEPSPLEKYDAAFNNAPGCATYPSRYFGPGAKAAWDQYDACAGPAARWQSKHFQGAGDLHDGIDNDGDGVTDDVGPSGDVDGMAGWWGTCHAWSPASLLVPEPQHAVTVAGVTFAVGDIKALIQNVYDGTSAIMIGGRCNLKTITHDPTTSANDPCGDVNPGALHVVMTNFLGIKQLPLVEDRTANYEVWNQPVVGYEITRQAKVSASAANSCVGASGSSWSYNPSAEELYEVRMTVKYVTEGSASRTPLGIRNNIRTDGYHYILEVSSAGKVIGGRYCTDSDNSHVDFLWSPTGRNDPSNPSVSTARVKELIAKSVARSSGGGAGTPLVFAATPNLAIADNDPTGVTADVAVTGVTGSVGLAVSVGITHSYRGDLVVELLLDGRHVKTLHDKTGGSQHDLVETYTLSPAEVGGSPNGTWSLTVTDTAAQDVGTFDTAKLEFR